MRYYTDDPNLDRQAHKLLSDLDLLASAMAGRDLRIGTCSCGTMPATPPWDEYAVFEAFDTHIADMGEQGQEAGVAARMQARQSAVDDWNARVPIGAPVRYWTGVREGEGKTSHTRSVARLLGGHTPVVWVVGVLHGITLTHIEPITRP